MSSGKRLKGLVLVGLGAIGSIACLAGVVGVWVAGSRLQQVNSEVFQQAEEVFVQVDRRAAKAREAVGGTRDLVEELKQTLQDSATELTAERMASLPELDNVERRLALAMERAEGLVEVSASTAELLEQLLATVGDIASERNVHLKDASELTATIRSTQESLAHASEGVADVGRALVEIREKRDIDGNMGRMANLSLGIVAKLDVVQDQLAAFRGRLDETRIRVAKFQDKFTTWILAGQCLIGVLLVWIGAGQYCLLLRGCQILRTTAPTIRG